MSGLLQTGLAGTFSNAGAADLVLRGTTLGNSIVVGNGAGPDVVAALYVTSNALGVGGPPTASFSPSVGGLDVWPPAAFRAGIASYVGGSSNPTLSVDGTGTVRASGPVLSALGPLEQAYALSNVPVLSATVASASNATVVLGPSTAPGGRVAAPLVGQTVTTSLGKTHAVASRGAASNAVVLGLTPAFDASAEGSAGFGPPGGSVDISVLRPVVRPGSTFGDGTRRVGVTLVDATAPPADLVFAAGTGVFSAMLDLVGRPVLVDLDGGEGGEGGEAPRYATAFVIASVATTDEGVSVGVARVDGDAVGGGDAGAEEPFFEASAGGSQAFDVVAATSVGPAGLPTSGVAPLDAWRLAYAIPPSASATVGAAAVAAVAAVSAASRTYATRRAALWVTDPAATPTGALWRVESDPASVRPPTGGGGSGTLVLSRADGSALSSAVPPFPAPSTWISSSASTSRTLTLTALAPVATADGPPDPASFPTDVSVAGSLSVAGGLTVGASSSGGTVSLRDVRAPSAPVDARIAYASNALTFLDGALTVSAAGGIVVDGPAYARAFNTYSDARLKRDVRPGDVRDDADRIARVPLRHFTMLEEDRPRYGVVAQELQRVVPEAVGRVRGVLSVDAGELLFRAIGAIQELQGRVAALEGR